MADEPASYTAEELTDPNIDAETLRQVAGARPDLWDSVLQHPNCYPELADYIRAQQGPPQPPEGQPQQQGPGAGEQMAAGARQLAGGAQDFFRNTAAPAVSGATRSARANGSKSWTFWPRLAQPVLALLGFITLFTPALRASDEYNVEGTAENLAEQFGMSDELDQVRDEYGLHTSQNFLTQDFTAAGVILLLLFLATIGLAVASLVVTQAWARFAAGAVGGLAGLIGIITSIIYLVAATEDVNAVGFGAVLMLLLSILLIAASAIALLPPKRATPPQPQH